jgi:hypothetical protein
MGKIVLLGEQVIGRATEQASKVLKKVSALIGNRTTIVLLIHPVA